MEQNHSTFSVELSIPYILSLLMVAATTGVLLLIGREKLGEAVIALLYLVPVGWSASQWGQGPGIIASLLAALAFDFYFIPPFKTFAVGRLEGWLVLAIFLAVAILVVGRIQVSLSKARASEREAMFMYEISNSLAGLRTQEAVAYTVARFLQQTFLATQVSVVIQSNGQPAKIAVQEPRNGILKGKPDRILPILNSWGLIGEIQIWRGVLELPTEDSRLLRNIASQAGQAFERTQLAEEERMRLQVSNPSVN
jgi:K+-sensing histidine kinase KdpD